MAGALIGVVGTVLAACNSTLTPDGTGYAYSDPAPGTAIITSLPTSGGNNREFFWDDAAPNETDSTICATFTSGQGEDQQGIALRVQNIDVDNHWSTVGITVTRNIYFGVYNVFNLHTWNTDPAYEASNDGAPFSQFGSVTLPFLPLFTPVYPLNMCARTVASLNIVQFVVWTQTQAQPPWGSTTQGGQGTLPANAPATGRGGWYAGHIVPGTTTEYTNLSVDGAVIPAGSIY